MLVHEAGDLGVRATNYFQAVNEGFVRVDAHNASITALGAAVRVVARHQGQRLLRPAARTEHARLARQLPSGLWVSSRPCTATDDPAATDLAVLASIDDKNGRLLVTAINGHAAVNATLRLAIAGSTRAQRGRGGVGSTSRREQWTASVLRATGITPQRTHISHGTAGEFEAERPYAIHAAVACSGMDESACAPFVVVTVVVPPYSLVHVTRED